MKRLGIDVSYCQSRVDWQKVKAAGVQFVMVRVGYCFNNGALHIDKMFQSHKTNLMNELNKISRIVERELPNAAKEVLQAVKPYKLTYPIAFDIEYEKEYPMKAKAANTEISAAFLREIEKAGYYAMLYCSKDFLDNYLLPERLTAFDKWIAQYASKCTSKHAHGIWQFSGSGKVGGIPVAADLNYAYKDYPAIIRRAKLNRLEG